MNSDDEDMIIEEIPNFNSKFKINARVRVLFDNGKYYYGNITKFIDNEKRQVHFDDGDVVEDVEEKELIEVKQKINSKISNNTDINNPKFISRLNSKNRASGLSRLEMEGFEVYFLSVQDEF
jgi:putative cell wall-binding protein